MGNLIVSWSPVRGQGSSTLTFSLASMLALDTTHKVLFTHAQKSKSILDVLFETSDKNDIADNGMEGLERLVKSNRLKTESVPDYAENIYLGKLDYLQSGFSNTRSDSENITFLFSVLKASLQAYEMVFVDLECGTDSVATKELVKQADVVLVNLPQNRYVVEQFTSGELMLDELRERDYFVVINQYDKNATYSIRNIKRQVKAKEKMFGFPYATPLKNAINLGNVSDFYFRSTKSKRGDATHQLTGAIREINIEILEVLGFTASKGGVNE